MNIQELLERAKNRISETAFQSFKEQVEKWIGEQDICAHTFDTENDRVIVVTKEEDPNAGMMSVRDVYSIYRIFRAGPVKWATSVDLTQGQGDVMADRLVGYIND
jgi:hypothetical protein